MHTNRPLKAQRVSDLARRVESLRPEKAEASPDHLHGRASAFEEQIEHDSRDRELETQLLVESIAILEERLLRVENSMVFRFNRAIGNFFKSKKRKLSQFLRYPLFDFKGRRFSMLRDNGYGRWVRFHEAALPSLEWHHERIKSLKWHPCISIVMATRHPIKDRLKEAIASVQLQSYENWQLCICDDASGEPWIEEYLGSLSEADPRIRFTLFSARRGISDALNTAAGLADGEYAGFLRQHNMLHQHCLYYLAEACQTRDVQVVYADEDCLDSSGRRVRPYFKPSWSPDLLTGCMYWGQFWIAERKSIEDVSGAETEWFRSAFNGAQDYDLALRLADKTLSVCNVPRVLHHRRLAASGRPDAQQDSHNSSLLAIEDTLRRRNSTGIVEPGCAPDTFFVRREIANDPLTSIVVCSCNLKLFERSIHQLAAGTDYDRLELVLVEHQAGSTPFPLKRLKETWKGSLVHIPYADVFNFAIMNNAAAKAANGTVLIFLNDDVEPLRRDWLRRMLGQIQRPEVGVVGARLLYPSGAIQHAGIALGMSLDGAGHPGRFLFSSDLFPWLDVTRNVTAVTGACLGIRKTVFQKLGGLDPQFPLDYNDVDLCLRARQKGYLVLYEAGAVLRHHESASRARASQYRERSIFHRRWASLLGQPDPYLPPALDRKTESIKLALWNGSGSGSDGAAHDGRRI